MGDTANWRTHLAVEANGGHSCVDWAEAGCWGHGAGVGEEGGGLLSGGDGFGYGSGDSGVGDEGVVVVIVGWMWYGWYRVTLCARWKGDSLDRLV